MTCPRSCEGYGNLPGKANIVFAHMTLKFSNFTKMGSAEVGEFVRGTSSPEFEPAWAALEGRKPL